MRRLLPPGAFFEIYCSCPAPVCEQRDPKGFYARARTGGLAGYTGVTAPYEEPSAAELMLDTGLLEPDSCAASVIALLEERGIIDLPRVPG